MSRNRESFIGDAAQSGPETALRITAEGFNYYSAILSEVINNVPSVDHPILVSLLRNYAEAIERHHPGTKSVAEHTDLMFETTDICIKFP